jgi:16S rRNA (guanine527-N7)-methyltransferase
VKVRSPAAEWSSAGSLDPGRSRAQAPPTGSPVFHVKHDYSAQLEGLSEDQIARLRALEDLLRRRAIPLGMISRADGSTLFDRHVLDSLRARRCLRADDRLLADIGSGAGLPGLPLAIARPDVHVALIEQRRKRAAFLELAVEELGLSSVSVFAGPVEQYRREADVAFARALAPAQTAWKLAARILRPSGRLVYFAGTSWASSEAQELTGRWISTEIVAQGGVAGQGPLVMMWRTPQPRDEE